VGVGEVRIHNSLSDTATAARFDREIRKALKPEEGRFVAWVEMKGKDAESVSIHLEEPGRKETLANVVEPWKRSTQVRLGASDDELRQAIERLVRS
jgi:hypothetical protein